MENKKIELVNQEIICLTPCAMYSYYINNIEEYARICFQSEGHIGESFVKRILVNQHESVLEHFNLSFKIITSRAIANALVRHRHCAYTQESTHYIDYLKRGIPLKFIKPLNSTPQEETVLINNYSNIIAVYEEGYKDSGKDYARNFLPLGLKTELRMTTNLREWRHIIRLRGAFDHPAMSELIHLLYDWFKEALPLFMEDIEIE